MIGRSHLGALQAEGQAKAAVIMTRDLFWEAFRLAATRGISWGLHNLRSYFFLSNAVTVTALSQLILCGPFPPLKAEISQRPEGHPEYRDKPTLVSPPEAGPGFGPSEGLIKKGWWTAISHLCLAISTGNMCVLSEASGKATETM